MSSMRSGWSKSFAEPLDGLGDAVGVATQGRDLTEPAALLSHQEPVDDLPRDQRREEARVGRGVQEPDEPHHGVQQARVQRAHVDGRHGGMAPRRGVAGLDHDRADEGGVELEDEAQIRALLRRLGDPARDGQRGGGDEVVRGVVPVAVVAQQDLLAALRDHAEGRVGHAMPQLRGRGRAVELQPFQRLDGPIVADGPRDALDQLVTAGLRPAAPRALTAGGSSNP